MTQNLFAKVDDDDYDYLNQWKWFAQKDKYTHYARRMLSSKNKKRQTISMHSLLVNANRIDHKDGDGLNNQKENLRPATRSQNATNFKSRKKKLKGIFWIEKTKKWRAIIGFNKTTIHLGYFENELDAAKAYDIKAKELFGEFAKTNFNI